MRCRPEAGYTLLETVLGMGLATLFFSCNLALEAKSMKQIQIAEKIRSRQIELLSWSAGEVDERQCSLGGGSYNHRILKCRRSDSVTRQDYMTLFLLD